MAQTAKTGANGRRRRGGFFTRTRRGAVSMSYAVIAGAIILTVFVGGVPYQVDNPSYGSFAGFVRDLIDSDPDPFTIPPVTLTSPQSGKITSDPITVSGISVVGFPKTGIGVEGDGNPEVSANGGSWAVASAVNDGQSFVLRVDAPAAGQTHVVNVTVGSYSTTWSVGAEVAYSYSLNYGDWGSCSVSQPCQGVGSRTRGASCVRQPDGVAVAMSFCDTPHTSESCESPHGSVTCNPQPEGSTGGSQICTTGSTLRSTCLGYTCADGRLLSGGSCVPDSCAPGSRNGFAWGTIAVGSFEVVSREDIVSGGTQTSYRLANCALEGDPATPTVSLVEGGPASNINCDAGYTLNSGSGQCEPDACLAGGQDGFAWPAMGHATTRIVERTSAIAHGTLFETSTATCSAGTVTLGSISEALACIAGYGEEAGACVGLGCAAGSQDGFAWAELAHGETITASRSEPTADGNGTLTYSATVRCEAEQITLGAATLIGDCSAGYHLEGETCVPDACAAGGFDGFNWPEMAHEEVLSLSRPVTVTNGSQEQTANATCAFGAVSLDAPVLGTLTCDTGYVSVLGACDPISPVPVYGAWNGPDVLPVCAGIETQTRDLVSCQDQAGNVIDVALCPEPQESRTLTSPEGTRACDPQPLNAIGGAQTCLTADTVWQPCESFTCADGFGWDGSACVATACTPGTYTGADGEDYNVPAMDNFASAIPAVRLVSITGGTQRYEAPASCSLGTVTVGAGSFVSVECGPGYSEEGQICNAAPSIDTIGPQSTSEDVAATVTVSLTDPDTDPTSLTLAVSSSNQGLVADSAISVAGGGASRTVTLTPTTDQSGTTTITVTVDDGLQTATVTFVLSVGATNDAPSVAAIANVSTDEDVGTSVTVSVADPDTAVDTLSVSASSSNQGLVPDANVIVSGSGASRSLEMTPLADQTGDATITVTVSDGQDSTSQSFGLTVDAVNDAPSLDPIPAQSTSEDLAASITLTVADIDTDIASLSVAATSSNQALVANGAISVSGTGANRTLSLTPTADQSGTTTITVTVDDGMLTDTQSFVLTVGATNDAPSLGALSNIDTDEDVAAAVSLALADPDTDVGSLTVAATSSDQGLIADGALVVTGSGANRSLAITPTANQTGVATITVTVSDGTANDTQSFTVTVNAVNDGPSLAPISAQTTSEDIAASVNLSVGDIDTDLASLTVAATSSNQSLVSDGAISVAGSGATRTLTLTPAAEQSGTATITVSVDDGALTDTQSFVLTVQAVDDPPSLAAIANVAVNEDGSTSTTLNLSDPDTNLDSLSVSANSSNQTLIPDSALILGGTGATRTLDLTPVADQNGSATITVSVSDASSSASESFTLTVTAVNDGPSLAAIGNQTTNEDIATSVTLSLDDVDTPAGSLVVSATSSDQSVITDSGLSASGSGLSRTLTVSPVANASGTATITVTVSDGQDSASQSFGATVNAVNDPPVLNLAAGNINIDESFSGSAAFASVSDFGPGESGQSVQSYTVTPTSQGAVSSVSIDNAGTISITTGSVTGNQVYTFTARAIDNGGTANGGQNTSTPVSFTITVVETSTPAPGNLLSCNDLINNVGGGDSFAPAAQTEFCELNGDVVFHLANRTYISPCDEGQTANISPDFTSWNCSGSRLTFDYNGALSRCSAKGSGWQLPEGRLDGEWADVSIIYAFLNIPFNPGFDPSGSPDYWGTMLFASPPGFNYDVAGALAGSNNYNIGGGSGQNYVRCVKR